MYVLKLLLYEIFSQILGMLLALLLFINFQMWNQRKIIFFLLVQVLIRKKGKTQMKIQKSKGRCFSKKFGQYLLQFIITI
jgi:hypothetical protein